MKLYTHLLSFIAGVISVLLILVFLTWSSYVNERNSDPYSRLIKIEVKNASGRTAYEFSVRGDRGEATIKRLSNGRKALLPIYSLGEDRLVFTATVDGEVVEGGISYIENLGNIHCARIEKEAIDFYLNLECDEV